MKADARTSGGAPRGVGGKDPATGLSLLSWRSIASSPPLRGITSLPGDG